MKKKNMIGLSGLLAVALGVMSPAIVRADEPVLGPEEAMVEAGMDLANAAIADAILNQAMQQLDAIAAAIQFVAGPSAPLVTTPVGSIPNTAALISNPAVITTIVSVASNIIAPPPVPPPPAAMDPPPVPVGVTPPLVPTPLFPFSDPGPSSDGPPAPPTPPNPPAPPVEGATPPAPPVEPPAPPVE